MKYPYEEAKLERMRTGKGFIAALDQSGGSTPKALKLYGVNEDQYRNDEEMFDLVHAMRTRIIKSPAFRSEHILAAILFEMTMDRKIDNKYTSDYLLEEKGILPILKIDKGLDIEKDGVQMMKPIPGMFTTLAHAKERHIFGTKMRSVIKVANKDAIKRVVDQQFEFAKQICDYALVPIIEPEVDIHIPDKKEAEAILKEEFIKHLKEWDQNLKIMFKLTLPDVENFYEELYDFPCVIRVVALSGGYSREEANKKLAANHKVIASFSRALTEGLNVKQTDDEFNKMLEESVTAIYEASIK
jgi:fructose-bisphosphate aldolase class I